MALIDTEETTGYLFRDLSRDLFIMFFRSSSLHLSNHSKSLKFSECGRVLSETNMCFPANGTISTDESYSIPQ